MNKKIILLLLLLATMVAFEVPHSVPNASIVGTTSTVTGLEYNNDSTLYIERYVGVNESEIAKRKYKHDDLFDYSDWNLDELFPNRRRDLADLYYKYIPGVIWIEKNFFIDETEISNIHWQEYCLHHPEARHTIQTRTLPADYYLDPKFRFYPVTGISHQQAEAFCKWRSEIVTSTFNKLKGYRSSDAEYTVFKFRLPTKSEWEKCAGYGLDLKKYPHGFKLLKSHLKFTKKAARYLAEMTDPTISVKELEQTLEKFNAGDEEDLLINCRRPNHEFLNLRTPFSVWSFPKNHFGIYNMLGNVGELVQEREIVKGGSWLDTLDACQILNTKTLSGYAEDIGFRTVCVLEWPNKNDM